MRSAWDDAMASLERALGGERFDEARAHATAAVEAGRVRFGEGHVQLAAPLYALAVAAWRLGDLALAQEASGRALDVSVRRPDATPQAAQICALRVAILELRGADAELVRELRGEALRGEVAGSASLLTALGLGEARLGELEPAGRSLASALVLAERPGATTRELAEALFNAATFPAAGVSDERRLAMLRRALGLVGGSSTELEARVRHNLGALLAQRGGVDEACEQLGAALELLSALVGERDPRLRPTLVRLADLHRDAGRSVLSLALHARALDLARAALPEEHVVVRALIQDVGGGTA